MDHERCSELLLPYLRGDLEPGPRDQVEEHLASCSDCSEEKAALHSLLSIEVQPLSATERDSLRDRVGEELAGPAGRGLVAKPVDSPKWWMRAIPALGAVALLAFAVVIAASLLSGRGDGGGGESAVTSGGGGGAQDKAPAGEGFDADTEAGAPAPEGAAGEAVPYFRPGRRVLTDKVLDDLARKEPAFKALAGVTSKRADALVETNARYLSDQAPPDMRAQVRDCAESVAASQGTVVPAYGTTGKYRGKDALLVGFVSGTNSGPLNRYMLWLWPRGSCDVPLGYVSGTIKK